MGAIDNGETQNFQQVLTPGDRADWTIEMQPGDVIVPMVSSDAFDPGLEIFAEDGASLAKIDDIRPGDQRARLLFEATKAGKYKLSITSFKSAAGGRFNLQLRRFHTMAIEADVSKSIKLDQGQPFWVKIPTKGNQLFSVTASTDEKTPIFEGLDMSGAQMGYHAGTDQWESTRRAVFGGPDIAVYVRVAGFDRYQTECQLSIHPVEFRKVPAANGAVVKDLNLSQGRVVEIHVDLGAATTVKIRPDRSTFDTQSYYAGFNPSDNQAPAIIELERNLKLTGSLNYSVLQKGELVVRVGSRDSEAIKQNVALDMGAIPMSLGKERKHTLPLGESSYFWFNAKAGELISISSTTDLFDGRMMLFGPDGGLEAESEERANPGKDRIVKMLEKTGRYLVSFRSESFAGGGEYTIEGLVNAPLPIKPGKALEVTTKAGEIGSYVVDAKPGQRVAVGARCDAGPVRLSVYGPDGQLIGTSHGNGKSSDAVLSLKTTSEGRYTVVVNAEKPGKSVVEWTVLFESR